jgi:hypothetical protein
MLTINPKSLSADRGYWYHASGCSRVTHLGITPLLPCIQTKIDYLLSILRKMLIPVVSLPKRKYCLSIDTA